VVTKIRKRNGRIADFDQDKITRAIEKSILAVRLKDRNLAQQLSREVINIVKQKFARKIPGVEDIQDVVENVLIKHGLARVAKAYILYRQKRKEVREAKGIFGVEDDLKLPVNAVRILEKRYLLKDESGNLIETPKKMFERVAREVASADRFYGAKFDPEKSEREFYRVMSTLEFIPNTPTLINAGTRMGQLSACFVLPVEDSMKSIFEAVKDMALIHQSGGGTGFSFSRLRPKGDLVKSTKGIASGPVSFMRVFDMATDIIKQGGRRRGANMGILRIDHPDILEFVTAKTKEGAFTNFNLSVAITDKFMKLVEDDKDYELINPRTGKPTRKLRARDVFNLIVATAWKTGDPGLVFIDRINKYNPTPQSGIIESTNPCIVGECLIATERGLEKIESIYQRHKNGNLNGGINILTDNRALGAEGVALRNSVKIYENGEKEVFKLITESGYELLATANHKVLTTRGWVKLANLNSSHEVMIQSGVGSFRKEKKLTVEDDYLNNFTNRAKLNLPTLWSRELGQVLGWLIGDGWLRIGDKDCRVGFTFAKNDRPLLSCLKSILNKWYGKNIREINRSNNSYQLSYHGKGFVEFFKLLGVKPFKAADKVVPESIFTAPREAIAGFLQGLFSSDGTINIYRANGTVYIRLSSNSERLLKEVQLLLLNFGIKSKIYDRKRPPQRKFGYTTIHGEKRDYCTSGIFFELQISRRNILNFLNSIGFIPDKFVEKIDKLRQRNFYSDKFYDKVKSIERHGKEVVYNLTEAVSGSYIASGIVVANCGEQPLLPYESCVLGSINLSKMVKKKKINWQKLSKVVRTAVHFLDNVIDVNKYPLSQIERITKSNRKIGLGVMGFAEMLIKLGIPYNSREGIAVAGKVMKFVTREAREKSKKLAGLRGVFPNFRGSIWDKRKIRVRNASLTTIAPTGTISTIAGCSSGIEPLFAISYARRILEGTQFLETNTLFEELAIGKGFYNKKLLAEIARKGSIQHVKKIPAYIRKIFLTAFDISPEWHVRMQAAFQKYTDNAVSKTVNLPYEATVEEVEKVYKLAYKLGCKGVTVYRYGSKPQQVLYLGSVPEGVTEEASGYVSVDSEYAGGCPTPYCLF